jgi:outer membrane protein assembly factor BamA
VGEQITDVKVLGNVRTGEDTIRSLAGVDIGDSLETDTLASVRERLNSSGLFADVNVWWENHQEGVRVNIAVKDKFPWAPVPTASWSANNKSFGLLFVHGNLFGRGKQMLIGGRIATVDSGAVLGYRDPALFGSWAYWELRAMARREIIPEYSIYMPAPDNPWRQTTIDGFGIEPAFGIAWFRRVKTQVAYRVEKINIDPNNTKVFDPETGMDLGVPPVPTIDPGTLTMLRFSLAFDWRAREHAVMMGAALGGSFDYSDPSLGSHYDFWRAGAFWEHGTRILRRHNFIYSFGAALGKDTVLWWDTTTGGQSQRGYLLQQFRGDTQVAGRAEYHFPLFSIGSLDVRGLGFYETSAIWFRSLPADDDGDGYAIRPTDNRSYNLNYVQPGFDYKRDFHNSTGGGVRFFLRSVAVPLVGFDAGYGIEAHKWRFILIVGA